MDSSLSRACPPRQKKIRPPSGSLLDPSGYFGVYVVSPWLTGIFVHSQIGADFVAWSPATRWANRTIRTIVSAVSGGTVIPSWIGPALLRPDLAEAFGGTGDLYEIKPGDFDTYVSAVTFGLAANAAVQPQLWGYRVVLNYVYPHGVAWSFGASYISGVRTWPKQWWTPLGATLVTFTDYAVAPGAILYDFIADFEANYLGQALSVEDGRLAAQKIVEVKAIGAVVTLAVAWAFTARQADEARLYGHVGIGGLLASA